MYLGLEIGGTKLQLGVGDGRGSRLIASKRLSIAMGGGITGVLAKIESVGRPIAEKNRVTAIGIGFAGPVDTKLGRALASRQYGGWEDFPLSEWCVDTFGVPAVIANNSNAAGLAEARFGAGQGSRVVLYSNVGSGIGGALVIEGQLHRHGGVVADIGQLRPGLQADRSDQTVESLASGWAITEAAQAILSDPISHSVKMLADVSRPVEPESIRQRLIEHEDAEQELAAYLLARSGGIVGRLNTKMVADAAMSGNELAAEIFSRACRVLGWAIAQAITIVAPDVVVVGGGVSLAGEEIFLNPLREYVRQYACPQLGGSYELTDATLGQEAVLHGLLALAKDAERG